jgi:hypothetical protein
MRSGNSEARDAQAPWWGIGILYLMLLPFAAIAYFAFKAFALVWNAFDGTVAAKYAVVVFGVGGLLVVVYLMMVVRQIYTEFIVPKLASRYSTSGPSEERK